MTRPKDTNSPSRWNMRIWDEKKKQWLCDGEDDVLPYYGFDIRGGEVTAMQSMDWVYRQFEHGRKLIWEQSTGVKDMNGKEIYEGDIVKFDLAIGIVKYKTPAFYLDCDISDWGVLGLNEKYSEVIGTIHENPELLGGKNE